MYMTTDGTIVLRVCSRGLLTSEYDCITEDYLTLEEDGEVLVDKMCAMHVRATEAPQQSSTAPATAASRCSLHMLAGTACEFQLAAATLQPRISTLVNNKEASGLFVWQSLIGPSVDGDGQMADWLASLALLLLLI
jgi:hypothetical protein